MRVDRSAGGFDGHVIGEVGRDDALAEPALESYREIEEREGRELRCAVDDR